MQTDKQKLRRKNLIVAWTMAFIAISLYVIAIYYQ